MILGRVCGTVVSTVEHPFYDGRKQLIVRALREAKGNRTVAAQKMGISRRTLHRKLHAYQLEGM